MIVKNIFRLTKKKFKLTIIYRKFKSIRMKKKKKLKSRLRINYENEEKINKIQEVRLLIIFLFI